MTAEELQQKLEGYQFDRIAAGEGDTARIVFQVASPNVGPPRVIVVPLDAITLES